MPGKSTLMAGNLRGDKPEYGWEGKGGRGGGGVTRFLVTSTQIFTITVLFLER